VASEELEQSLREQIDSFIRARLSEVQEQVSRIQNEVNDAVGRINDLQRKSESVDQSLSDAISEHLQSARESGMAEATEQSKQSRVASDIAVLKAAIDDIDDQRTQADILTMLVNRSTSFAPRVGFFVVKNDRIIGWRARGLEGSVGDDAIREIWVSTSADTSLGEAVRSGATFSGYPEAHSENKPFLEKLGTGYLDRIVAVPLVVRGKSVAVLYGDSGSLGEDSINLEAMETLVRVAGMAVELLAVSRATPAARAPQADTAAPESPAVEQTAPATPAPSHQAAEPTPEPQNTWEAGTPAYQTEPEAAPAPAEKFGMPEPQPEAEDDQDSYGYQPAPQQIEETPVSFQPEPVNGSYQPVVEPAVPAFTTPEPATAGALSSPLGTARRYGSNDADLPVEVNDEERRLHNDARRFARLLVSEIKLYNEQKVREGRSQGDIYERLREDIDRSREMYDKRVAPPVAAKYDYFHQEVVNTLADGDAGRLGGTYPGATV
jgi:hypothetical protein